MKQMIPAKISTLMTGNNGVRGLDAARRVVGGTSSANEFVAPLIPALVGDAK